MSDEEDDPKVAIPTREALVALRFEKGMTREDIAEYYKVSTATVRRWIKDQKVPRPSRRKKPARVRPPAPPQIGDGYSRFEQARIILEGRVIERTGLGYYLDGRPANVEGILLAAGV